MPYFPGYDECIDAVEVYAKIGAPMEAELIVIKGKATKAAIPLKLPTIIGRSRKADLTVAHPMVSRRHCEVFEADGLLMVRDLDSLNGTLVTGRRVKKSPLPPDSELTIGPLTFRAHYQYAGDLSQLPAAELAESKAAAAPAAGDEELPAIIVEGAEAEPECKATAETVEAPKKKSADPSELPDDLFEEFLKGD
jgi:predicted component of type VI protein secretion system